MNDMYTQKNIYRTLFSKWLWRAGEKIFFFCFAIFHETIVSQSLSIPAGATKTFLNSVLSQRNKKQTDI